MNEQELQLAMLGYVVATKKQPKSDQEIMQIQQEVQALAQQKPEQYRQLVQLGQQAQQQMSQQGTKAKLGAKLNYINKLKGNCPEGEELVYMKEGGRVCPKCVKKASGGTQAPKKKEEKKNPVDQWKTDRAKAKDEAARDSVAINKYNDQEIMVNKGHKGKFKNGVWTPNRKEYTKKNACGSKMKEDK